jgi:hypothetical protein
MPPFAAVMAHGTMPRPAPKLANGQTQLSLAITRWTRVRGHKSVPEFTANAFVADWSGFNLQAEKSEFPGMQRRKGIADNQFYG